MRSRNVSPQRTVVKSILWLLCASLMALAAIIPARTESAPTATRPNLATFKIYCASSLDQPTVYFTNIFDANLKAQSQISTLPLSSAFKNYLVKEYDFKSSSGASCGFFDSLAKAEANKRQLMVQAQQANKRVIEVNWDHGPLSETPVGDGASIGIAGPVSTHTFCAVPHEVTMYYSAVFKTAGALVNPKWNDAFNEFLYKTYGFNAEVEATCTIMATNREAEAILNARVKGARINSHKVVETGWKFDPTGTYKPAPKPTPKADDDPEPVQRPAAPNPSRQTSDVAMKEVPAAVAYCQKDPSMSASFNCDNFGRAIYNYRMAHLNEPLEPLATVVAKLNCVECVDTVRVSSWVENRAGADRLSNKAINCVTQNVIVNLQKTPQANRLKEFYSEAVATCSR
jgi:hypothetical protein